MKPLYVDIETYDPLLKRYGSGWVFKYHYPEVTYETLCFCCITSDGEEISINMKDDKQAKDKIIEILQKHDTIVGQNIAYDLGALRYFLRDRFDSICIYNENYKIYDTLLMAKADKQYLRNYSLSELCKEYGTNSMKQSDILHEYAWKSGLFQQNYADSHKSKSGKGINKKAKPTMNSLEKFCKTNMNLFPFDIVSEYCMQDIKATKDLFLILFDNLQDCNSKNHTDIIKVCLDMKTRGMPLNLAKANDLCEVWLELASNLENEIKNELKVDGDFNIKSTKAMPLKLAEFGYNLPTTEKGNKSVNAKWLEENADDPLLSKLLRYKRALKARKDFTDKLVAYQEIIPDKYRSKDIGILYPTLKPFGAKKTGRFSSGGGTGCLELNILAIPRRNEDFGLPIREIFIADENEKIVCCDFSNQEPRLQVHYAKRLSCEGSDLFVEMWKNDPNMKFHEVTAKETGLEYDLAKMVTLMISYNGSSKGLSNKLKISKEEAQHIIDQYYDRIPFMKQLQTKTSKNLKKLGYIRTIGGRKLKLDPPMILRCGDIWTQENKAMSKLIQGSGADQIIKSMVDAWKAGLRILASIHDEIIISTMYPDRDLIILKNCMENAYMLEVPVVVDAGIGESWGQAK